MPETSRHWMITLFPTASLAMLAVLNTMEPPTLVVIDESSILNQHVSGMMAPRLGHVLRTYSQWEAELKSGRANAHPKPSTLIAVHHNLEIAKDRMAGEDLGGPLRSAWNHVEDVSQEELAEVFSGSLREVSSAGLKLPGFPGSVGVLITREKQSLLIEAAVGLGLDYRDAAGETDIQNCVPSRHGHGLDDLGDLSASA